MEDPHPPIARYLRERRESLGLTRTALSAVAGVSPGLIQKIEQGTRPPTLEALLALCAALQIPEPFRDHLVSLSLADRFDKPAPLALPVPATDQLLLDSFAHPASLQSFPTFDVHAVNHAWTRQFPGLVPGTTLLEWMLLDPVARTVVVEWERQIHASVYSFRVIGPGLVPKARIEELVASCSRAPEWDRLWTTEPPPPHGIDNPELLVRHVDTGEPTALALHNLDFGLPRRPWALVLMVPRPDG
ncbi:helix-turn-helix domain-containing protein [Nocardia neocaledoniensis]|uniref:helix-turn-helix domain-containing protein n=1 Tax=Nocardia neocaledoniensis TaxID=236511 RepID=UPI0033CC0CC1